MRPCHVFGNSAKPHGVTRLESRIIASSDITDHPTGRTGRICSRESSTAPFIDVRGQQYTHSYPYSMSGHQGQDVVPPSSPSERLTPIIAATKRNVPKGLDMPVTPPGLTTYRTRRCSPGDPGTDGTHPRPFVRPGRCSPGLRLGRCSPGDDIPVGLDTTSRVDVENVRDGGHIPIAQSLNPARSAGDDENIRIDRVETLATWDVAAPAAEEVPAESFPGQC